MHQLRIFLADDDADDRMLFQEALLSAGIAAELTTAEDGYQLMDSLAQIAEPPPPDLIFLDINMPGKDGKACLREIRNNNKFDKTPVVMFTTSTYLKDIEDTYREGANMYVSKTDFFMNDVQWMKAVLASDWQSQTSRPPREKFMFSVKK